MVSTSLVQIIEFMLLVISMSCLCWQWPSLSSIVFNPIEVFNLVYGMSGGVTMGRRKCMWGLNYHLPSILGEWSIEWTSRWRKVRVDVWEYSIVRINTTFIHRLYWGVEWSVGSLRKIHDENYIFMWCYNIRLWTIHFKW